MSVELKYRRILLKLSGEALGPQGYGIDAKTVQRLASEVKRVHDLGIEVAMVVGGGNMWRGADAAANNLFSKGPIGPLQGLAANQRKLHEAFLGVWHPCLGFGIRQKIGPYTCNRVKDPLPVVFVHSFSIFDHHIG